MTYVAERVAGSVAVQLCLSRRLQNAHGQSDTGRHAADVSVADRSNEIGAEPGQRLELVRGLDESEDQRKAKVLLRAKAQLPDPLVATHHLEARAAAV